MRKIKRENCVWEKFWRLLVLWEWEHKIRKCWRKRIWVRCRCDCWTEWNYLLESLRCWHTKSCWCYHIDMVTKHKLSWTSFYNIWIWINQRCNNINATWYKNYWWRWIKCLRKTFEEFKVDMYDDYLIHLKQHWWWRDTSIERIDNDGDYCKDNCIWLDWSGQCKNRRCNFINLKQYRNVNKLSMILEKEKK